MFNGKRVVGIIAEFNPFHEGHSYLIRYAREKYQAEYVVIAMSGDFVQRGEPGFFSKFERSEKALKNGADLILQMPVMFSTASAEDFAACGVAMMAGTGIVDVLCFGSECGSLEKLERIADFLLEEDSFLKEKEADIPSESFSGRLREKLREGLSFPAAREAVLREFLDGEELSFTANDILGVEYLKAMKRQKVSFTAGVLTRNLQLRSAHSIREEITESCGKDCDHRCYAELDMLSEMLSYRLLELDRDGISYTEFSDVSEELAQGIRKQIYERKSYRERIETLKSKNYTYSRISRAFLHILLGIRKEEQERARTEGYVHFHRVLGVSKKGRELLGSMALPTLTSAARWVKDGGGEDRIFRTDIFASRVYGQIYRTAYNDFTEKLLVL